MNGPTPQQVERVIRHIEKQIQSWGLVKSGLKQFRDSKVFTAAGVDLILDGLIGLTEVKLAESSANLEVQQAVLEQARSAILVPEFGRRQ